MTVEAELPDGTVLEFPDDTPDAVIQNTVKQQLGLPPLGTERVGTTPEGRPMIQNPDGSVSTERTITVTHPRINSGKPTNIPSMFGGEEVSEEEAVKRIIRAGGKDPETGRALSGFATIQEAVNAARVRSESILQAPIVQGDTEIPPQEGQQVSTALPEFSGTGTPEAPPLNPIEDPTFLQGIGREFLRTVLNNAGAVPGQVLGNTAPRGEPIAATDTPSLFGPITGNIMEGASALAGKITGQDIPAQAAEGVAGLDEALTGENALAALRVPEQVGNILTNEPVQNFGQLQGTEAAITREFKEKAPAGTAVGGVLGDVATLAAGRRAVGANSPAVQQAVQQAMPVINQTANTVVLRALQTVGRAAKTTGLRAARTGTEAAFLASLQGVDLAQAGGTAAGAQALSDTGAAAFRALKKRGLLKSVATAALISLAIKQFTPGGLDRILPTLEDANKGVVLANIIGGAGGLLLGDISKGLAGPGFAALGDVLKRGTIISLLNSAARDPSRVVPVIQKFSEDPDFFGPKSKRLLERAINSDKIDVRNTINKLMENPIFKKKFEALGQ